MHGILKNIYFKKRHQNPNTRKILSGFEIRLNFQQTDQGVTQGQEKPQ